MDLYNHINNNNIVDMIIAFVLHNYNKTDNFFQNYIYKKRTPSKNRHSLIIAQSQITTHCVI